MKRQADGNRGSVRLGRIATIVIAARCLVRGLPLFVSARPRTPLRVLCIAAFDMLHILRTSQRLSATKLRLLAVLLDFGACANAAFDNKRYCRHEYRRTLQLLDEAGIRASVDEYMRRLHDLESERPLPGGGPQQFQQVGLYRETVVRLSLAMVATTADGIRSLEDGIRATERDAGLNILFRIVMQCQIIDDVLDHSKDLSAGLPSFLTACESLPQSFEQIRLTSLDYAGGRDISRASDVFSLRLALILVSACATLIICLGRWRQRTQLGRQFTERAEATRPLTADVVEQSVSSTTSL